MGQSRIGWIIGQVLADGIRGYFATTGAHIVVLTGLMVAPVYGACLVNGIAAGVRTGGSPSACERLDDGLCAGNGRSKQEEPTIQPKRARLKVSRVRETEEPELDREVQVVAEAVEQIAVPMIPPKIQPPMKVENVPRPMTNRLQRWPRARPSQMAMSCLTRRNYSVTLRSHRPSQ